ncbi:glutamine-dependent NAD(+) synthetase [Pleosporales sp. CAS-2024a]
MGTSLIVAACSLNQWALDWEGNLARIKHSIAEAKSKGASLRTGPELESDNIEWQSLADTPKDDAGRLSESGAEVLCCLGHVLSLNCSKFRVLTVDTGPAKSVEEFYLPHSIAEAQGGTKVPIGNAVVAASDVLIAAYSYTEILMPEVLQMTAGDEKTGTTVIHAVSNASYHELGASVIRSRILGQAAARTGGRAGTSTIVYSDQRGCGGDRTYSDGCAMIYINGQLVAQGKQYSLTDVEVITATIEIDALGAQQVRQKKYIKLYNRPVDAKASQVINIDDRLGRGHGLQHVTNEYANGMVPQIYSYEEQMAMGTSCWLFDYLRRSDSTGFLVPLSGGIDSCCTAVIVYNMCHMVLNAIREDNATVLADVQHLTGLPGWVPRTAQELCNRLLHTVYMGMGGMSSIKTHSRASRLAERLGAYHTDMNIDDAYQAEKDLARRYLGHAPEFDSGHPVENLALQNIQARIRMVTAYYFAQVLPIARKQSTRTGSLLVLGSVNVEECLRGSLTKHDCSSADLSPIGSFSKMEIRDLIGWARTTFALPILDEFLDAVPTAELEPLRHGQSDHKEMGMTQVELSTFARLRKEKRLGPVSMFQELSRLWRKNKSSKAVAELVNRFYHFYSINRHKMSTIGPAHHAGRTDPDNHRHDMRPMLYPRFEGSWASKRIEEMTEES